MPLPPVRRRSVWQRSLLLLVVVCMGVVWALTNIRYCDQLASEPEPQPAAAPPSASADALASLR